MLKRKNYLFLISLLLPGITALAQGDAWTGANVRLQEWGGGNTWADAVVTVNDDGSHTVSANKAPNNPNGNGLGANRRSRLLFNGVPVNVVAVNGILSAGDLNPATNLAYNNEASAAACTVVAGADGWSRNEVGDGLFTWEYTVTENPTHYFFMEDGGAKLGCDLMIDASLADYDMRQIYFSMTFDKDDRFVSATIRPTFYDPESVSEWVKMAPIIRQWGPNNIDANTPASVDPDGNGGHIYVGRKAPNGGISNIGLDGMGCARVLIPNFPANVFVVNQFAKPEDLHPLGASRNQQAVTVIGSSGWVKNGNTYTLTLEGDDEIFYHFYAEGNNTITDDLYLSPALAGSVIKDYSYTLYFDSADQLTKAVIDVDFTEIVEDTGVTVDPDNVNTGSYTGKLIWAKKDSPGSFLTPGMVARAFDNDPSTSVSFGSQSGYQWVGVDLGEAKPVSHVSYTVADGTDWTFVRLGVFQGANKADFSDAVPLFMITEESAPQGGKATERIEYPGYYRYLRYVGPGHGMDNGHDTYFRLADMQFIYNDGVNVNEGGLAVETNVYKPTNLPLVIVNTTAADPATGQAYDYFDGGAANKSERNTLAGSTVIVVDGYGKVNLMDINTEIRGRGNSSWSVSDKRPFRIKLNKGAKILDAPAKGKKWTMINNWGDKTLMRNIVGFEMGRRIGMDYVPYAQAVDLIFNGQYMGCYQLCDQIDIRKGRVNATEVDREAEGFDAEAVDGGFLVEVDGYAFREADNEWFLAKAEDSSRKYSIPVTIKEPDILEDYLNDPVRQNMEKSFNKMIQSVFEYGDKQSQAAESNVAGGPLRSQNLLEDGDPDYYFNFYVKDFLKYLIVEDYVGNPDAFWSTYMYKEQGDPQWHVGPMWDLDIAFGNKLWLELENGANNGADASDPSQDRGQHSVFFPYEAKADWSNYIGSFASDMPLGANWGSNDMQYENGRNSMARFVNIIINDPQSKQQLKELWSGGQNNQGLRVQDIHDYIDNKASEIKPSADLNFARWPILAAQVHENYANQPATYDAHIQNLKNYVEAKHKVLHDNYGYIEDYTTTGIENVTSTVEPGASIKVVAGGIEVAGADECEVYGVDGRLVYAGASASVVVLRPGFYIVEAAGKTAKVLVK